MEVNFARSRAFHSKSLIWSLVFCLSIANSTIYPAQPWKVMEKYGGMWKKIMIPISKSDGKFMKILADVIEFHQQNSMKTGAIGKQREMGLGVGDIHVLHG